MYKHVLNARMAFAAVNKRFKWLQGLAVGAGCGAILDRCKTVFPSYGGSERGLRML